MNTTTLGVVQCRLGGSVHENVNAVIAFVREAAAAGAQIVVTPELLEGPYFCQDESEAHFDLAREADGHPTLAKFAALAAELQVVLPVSFFERAGPRHYNSLAVFDADGRRLGVYRKSHIPDGPGYEEKFYFNPGDTGFRVWQTRYGCVGAGICWDQWFPECARAMALMGAEFLLYPTAIGSEPAAPEQQTRDPWRRAMQGHSACNAMPVVASNRIGAEGAISFYGSSFITDGEGALVAEFGEEDEGVIVHPFDRDALRRARAGWGFFRDRRPDLYGPLTE